MASFSYLARLQKPDASKGKDPGDQKAGRSKIQKARDAEGRKAKDAKDQKARRTKIQKDRHPKITRPDIKKGRSLKIH